MSRWDLPVPESPIRQSGSPFLTQSQVARVLTTAGLMAGLASKSKSASHLGGETRRRAGSLGAAAVAVLALAMRTSARNPRR